MLTFAYLIATFMTLWEVHATTVKTPTPEIYLFIAGQPPQVNNYRIPAIARTAQGTLVTIVEARSANSDCEKKWLVLRRSVDNGTTWGPMEDLFGPSQLPGTQTAGNPAVVYDTVTKALVVLFVIGDATHCNPGMWNMVISDEGSDGLRWGKARNVTEGLGKWAGAMPGPGTAAQEPSTGRLLVPLHYGAYGTDVIAISTDHGATWALSPSLFPKMDEAVVCALPNGSLMVNVRLQSHQRQPGWRKHLDASDSLRRHFD